MGNNGSGYSEKKRSFCYGPQLTTSEEEEEAWKLDKFRAALEFIKLALTRAPEDEKASLLNAMGSTLSKLNDNKAAIELYKEQIASCQGNPALFHFKLAETLAEEEGAKAEAMEHALKATELSPTMARAWNLLSKLHPEGSDDAAEASSRAKFLEWIPPFLAEFLPFNDTNRTRVDRILVDPMPLLNDFQQMSDEELGVDDVIDILGAIMYHHYHGPVDDTSAALLEKLAEKGNARAADRLVSLIENQQSVCTIRLAMRGLCRAKDSRAFDFCRILLPQDGQGFFPMDIAGSLELLDDTEHVVPLLVSFLGGKDDSAEEEDSDSDDFMGSMGQSMNQDRCVWSLGHYAVTSEKAKEFLESILTNERFRSWKQIAAAALFRSTKDVSYVKKNIFVDGVRVDGAAVDRLKRYTDESEELKQLIEDYERGVAEEEERRRVRHEFGVENWQPTEEQIALWNEQKKIDMGDCLAREVPLDLPEKVPCITELDFRANRLTTVPTEVINKWPELKKINFQANRITGVLPNGALVHPGIEEMGFHANNIQQLNSDIGLMTNLRKLSLTSNALVALPESITKLTNLEELDLDRNQELSFLPDISHLTKLTSVSLMGCNFHEIPAGLPKLTGLKSLNINDNKISFLPEFKQSFEWIRLANNQLKTIPYRLYKNAKHRYVDNNPFLESEDSEVEVGEFSLVEQALRKAYNEKSDMSTLPEDLRSDLQDPSFCDHCGGVYFRYHVDVTVVATHNTYNEATKIPLVGKFCQHHPEAFTAFKKK